MAFLLVIWGFESPKDYKDCNIGKHKLEVHVCKSYFWTLSFKRNGAYNGGVFRGTYHPPSKHRDWYPQEQQFRPLLVHWKLACLYVM